MNFIDFSNLLSLLGLYTTDYPTPNVMQKSIMFMSKASKSILFKLLCRKCWPCIIILAVRIKKETQKNMKSRYRTVYLNDCVIESNYMRIITH